MIVPKNTFTLALFRLIVYVDIYKIYSARWTEYEDICSSIKDRVDCSSGVGDPGSNSVKLSQELCTERGCCYDNLAAMHSNEDQRPSCFYPTEGNNIEVVHMINSNHFDAGYADLTVNILNDYFDKYFPQAAKTGEALRRVPKSEPGSGPLKWMTFAWIISLYFDCPQGYGLHCPTSVQKKLIAEAIQNQDIVWPAFPHNAELATMDASFLKFGVKVAQDLAVSFNISIPTVVSTRDVPGMPIHALEHLHAAGVSAISEGMNGRITPVNVPPAFQWKVPTIANSSVSSLNLSLPTMWHWHGYGQLGEPGDPIRCAVFLIICRVCE